MDLSWALRRVVLSSLGLLLVLPVFCRLLIRFFKVGLQLFQVKERTTPPACLTRPNLGQHKYMTVNGVSLHYVEAGDAAGPLILFLHGFPEFWYSWRHQIRHFQKEYRVVAIDMRGYADSSKPAGVANYTMDLLVEDVRSLVANLGVKRFHLVAHDWGAAVGWSFAALHPQMLLTYTACNLPHLTSLREQQQASLEQMLKSWYILFFQSPVIPELTSMANDMELIVGALKDANLHKDEELVEAFKYSFRDFKTWNRAINYYRGALSPQNAAFNKLLKEIKVPCMVIFGTGDKYLSVAAARGSAKYCPDFRLELLEGVSHWVQQEQPEKVNAFIESFVKAHK